jgi:hypothetical protein
MSFGREQVRASPSPDLSKNEGSYPTSPSFVHLEDEQYPSSSGMMTEIETVAELESASGPSRVCQLAKRDHPT